MDENVVDDDVVDGGDVVEDVDGADGADGVDEEKRKPCNARIDELAKPNKRFVLGVWENFAYNFSPSRQERMRLLLQELYSMTSEETELYFNQLSKIIAKLAAREKQRKRLFKRYRAKRKRIERRRAFNKFRHIFIKGLNYASKHPVPPLVSPRLRNMSDLILDHICDIRCLDVPERTNNDREAQFLFNIADWISIAIGHIYYEINVQKNKELELIQQQMKAEQRTKKDNYKRS